MERKDPRNMPEWRAIALECKLIRQLLGSGLTGLGRADYADQMGQYYNAFFSLSIGLERLGKLIFCFDSQQKNGRFPTQSKLKAIGHRVKDLIDISDKISSERQVKLIFSGQEDAICIEIVSQLDAFADAEGRYANFSTMEGLSRQTYEPLSSWSTKVGNLILDKHFRNTISEKMRSQMRYQVKQ